MEPPVDSRLSRYDEEMEMALAEKKTREATGKEQDCKGE